MTKIQTISKYNYRLVSWDEFEGAKDKPDGLLERGRTMLQEFDDPKSVYVVYDPCDDVEGFFIMGTSLRDLANQSVEYIKELYTL